jgi:fumarate reductase flavoprotein subunit
MRMSDRYDVIVIGGGIAGLIAARRAGQQGLRAAVLERGSDEHYACNSRYSGGILHIAFHNIREPAGALLNVIETATRGHAKPELAQTFAANAGRVVDWLRDEGIQFISVGTSAYQQWTFAPPRPITPGLDWKGRGADVMMHNLEENLQKSGGVLLRGTAAAALIVEGGRIAGVEVLHGGETQAISARAVVIADGGFQGNLELVRENISAQPAKVMQRGAGTGVGDGLSMARAVGAATSGLTPFYGHLLSRDAFNNDKVWPYPQCDELGVAGIVINHRGERFVDEGRGGVYVANAIARLDDPLSACAIFDERVWQGPGKNARIPANPLLLNAGATVHAAPTLAALAALIGVPAQKLERTVREYNDAHAAGTLVKLEPERSSEPIPGNAPIPTLPIKVPPYYAVPLCAGITFTTGGIAIDAHARVLRASGEPIAGLYAAGSCTGGLEGGPGAHYLGGLMKAAVFGLVAAEHIAVSAKAGRRAGQ